MHTPAPWKVVGPSKPDNTGGRDYCIIDTSDKIIAEAFEHVGRESASVYQTRPAEANARLIAASPDLLVALKEAVAYIRQVEMLEMMPYTAKGLEAANRADAAIAKAEGR